MKILLTGASSFTGFWFAHELTQKGHNVFATFTRNNLDSYDGIRRERLLKLLDLVKPIWHTKFGDKHFIKLLKKERFDLVCHHGAFVENYKDDNFDYINALKNNTFNIIKVLDTLAQSKKGKIVITGSVFEAGEGFGSNEAFSPYGLSKQFTSEIFKYFCKKNEIPFAKFVIPNPFGPYEDERFTYYLLKNWVNGETPTVRTPIYIRDNIHISLLAKVYEKFCTEFHQSTESFSKINPSGYIESQGAFAKRFGDEMSMRLNIPCRLKYAEQTEFQEPLIKINMHSAVHLVKDWNEKKAWDEMANYYKGRFLNGNEG